MLAEHTRGKVNKTVLSMTLNHACTYGVFDKHSIFLSFIAL